MRSQSSDDFVGCVVGILNVFVTRDLRLYACEFSYLLPRYPLKAKWYIMVVRDYKILVFCSKVPELFHCAGSAKGQNKDV